MIPILSKLLAKVRGKQDEPLAPQRLFVVTEAYECASDPNLPFPILNPMQSCFRDNYDPKNHCVVESGTGTGKTALAYIAGRHFLDRGLKVIITAPTRELVKSLYREALVLWGAKIVGMATGDDKDISEKHFVVTTPEGYLSAVRSDKEWTKAGLMIVDEAHNILEASRKTMVETSRGGNLDVAITIHIRKGGKVLLMSGTFPNKKEIAKHLKADLFISDYRKTKINIEEMTCPDDLDARAAPKEVPKNVYPTMSGHVFNRESIRLQTLKSILVRHSDESVIVFVPTKAAGFCLSESLVVPFHCADIAEKEKDRLVAEFNAGLTRTILATTTLAQGVNTPADVVIVFGTRSGGNYLDKTHVDQMFGRAGRGKPEATVYIIGDPHELFQARKNVLARSLPLPVEALVLTILSLQSATRDSLLDELAKTYSSTLSTPKEMTEIIDKYVSFLINAHIAEKRDAHYALTKEGHLLARYLISPRAYLKYIVMAKDLMKTELPALDQGFLLLNNIISTGEPPEYPSKHQKDFEMFLIDLYPTMDELLRKKLSRKAGFLKYTMTKPSIMPQYLPFQMRDASRWVSMLSDMEKYKVKEKAPGKECLKAAIKAIEIVAAQVSGKKPHRPKGKSPQPAEVSPPSLFS